MKVENEIQLTHLVSVCNRNALTFPKYRSRTSTYRWIISSVINSLSSVSIPVIKNSDAYLGKLQVRGTFDTQPWYLLLVHAREGPLYSRKLHILRRRERTSWVTSLTILDFSFGERVVNHFARRTLPCRETRRT